MKLLSRLSDCQTSAPPLSMVVRRLVCGLLGHTATHLTPTMRAVVLFAALLAVGCTASPLPPTPAPTATIDVAAPVLLVWPVAHPDGAYGHEDARYPPAETLCPAAYAPHYNGWNWLCQGAQPWLREFPSTRWRATTERGRQEIND